MIEEENKNLDNDENQQGSDISDSSSSTPSFDSPEEEEFEKITVKQVSLKWGGISGVVGILVFLILAMTGLIYKSSASWISAVPFIVILVLAHKEFKNEGDGYMNYSKGLGIGVFISAVSAVISTIFTYIYIKFVDTEYYENMNAALLEQWEEQGMTDQQIEAAMDFTSNMQNPELGILFGILGGVFFGFIISLIVTAFTKKASPEEDI